MVPGKFLKILNRLNLLGLFNLSTRIRVNNRNFLIPVKDGLGIDYLNLSEPWMIQLLDRLKRIFPGHFTDIGVNLGQTLIKVYSVYDNFQYTGFEPNPACVTYVQELVRKNEFKRCKILPVGISDNTGILNLNFFYDNKIDSSASMIEEFRSGEKIDHSIHISVANLSVVRNYLPEIKHSFLKIDVEGAELEVLKGLFGWIKDTEPVIIAEILPVYTEENSFRYNRQKEVEKLLHGLDYSFARIRKKCEVTLEQINSIGIHSNLEDCDYVIFPKSLESEIKAGFSSN